MVTVQATTRTFKTSIDIAESNRAKLIDLLNQHLADSFDLLSQVKQAHWNVKGHDFWQLHKLFDDIAEPIGGWIDEIAERVTALGGYANGTARMAAANSRLVEFPTKITDGPDYVQAVAARVAAYAKSTREAMEQSEKWGDLTTQDLFIEISRDADKYLYFLEAHLQA